MALDRKYALLGWAVWQGLRYKARRSRRTEPPRRLRWVFAALGLVVIGAGVARYRARAMRRAPSAYDGPLPPAPPGAEPAPGEDVPEPPA